MPILSQPPADVFQVKLLRLLKEKSKAEDGLSEKAHRLITTATPLLDLIASGPFSEFTLHNRDHPKKLLHLMEFLLPDSTCEALSALECYVLVAAAFLHDLGMVLTSTERERILASEELQDSIREWPELSDALAQSREQVSGANPFDRLSYETEVFQLQEAALCNYLRPLHATRPKYRDLIIQIKRTSGRTDLFSVNDVSFEESLIEICESHNLDVGVLAEVSGPYDERFPRSLAVATFRLNTQLCGALLRIADIMDFDRERTPRVLFESLAIASRSVPGADVTLKEWQKHMAVSSLEIDDEELVITAECHHPVIERAVREFCQLIERELRETNAVIQRNTEEIARCYKVKLPITVRPKIRSIGYVFKDMALRLNESAIMSLLMGDRLYSHQGVAIREVVQNAIDACQMRRLYDSSVQFTPKITLTSKKESDGRVWLEIEDNGIGMDEYVLTEFFLRIGTSYYSSPEFKRIQATFGNDAFIPISRFGIGLLAVFMVGDAIEVITRNPHSRRRDFVERFLRIERMGGLAFVRETHTEREGTLIRIRLKKHLTEFLEDFYSRIIRYIQGSILRPIFPVMVDLGKYSIVLDKYRTFSLKESGKAYLESRGLEIVILDIGRWSDQMSGAVALMFESPVEGGNSEERKHGRLGFGDFGVRTDVVFSNYFGNVLTVSGFKMNLKKAARVYGSIIPIAFDIDVAGDSELTYSISREKIMGEGSIFFKTELRKAIKKGLTELGIIERLKPRMRRVIDDLGVLSSFDPEERGYSAKTLSTLTPEMIEAIRAELPQDHWPVGVHRTIAEKLGLTPGQVSTCITWLLREGKIVNPNSESGPKRDI